MRSSVVNWEKYSTSTGEERLRLRDEIAMEYLPLVIVLAKKLYRSQRRRTELDDLIQDGSIALMGAIERFDLERRAPFRAYAASRITGAMLDGIRDWDWVPRGERSKNPHAVEMRQFELGQDKAVPRHPVGWEMEQAEICGIFMHGLDRDEILILEICVLDGADFAVAANAIGVDRSRVSQIMGYLKNKLLEKHQAARPPQPISRL